MPPFEQDHIEARDRRALVLPIAFLLLALLLVVLPVSVQQRIASTLRTSVLLPFIWTQEGVSDARVRAQDLSVLQSRFDSAVTALAAQRTLGEENERLRALLDLRERAGPGFVGASALYSGTAGSEGMFLIDVGEEDGIRPGDPVVVAEGLVGVVREAAAGNATVMDWSHPDFRVSVMTVDGETFGIVEPRTGVFRGGARLLLSSVPYWEPVEPGVQVVTSGGPGLLYPRGIVVGTVEGLAEGDPGDAGWRRSYWIAPAAYPGNASHVLVMTGDAVGGEGGGGVGSLWVPLSGDTAWAPVEPEEPAAVGSPPSGREAAEVPLFDAGAPGADGADTPSPDGDR